MPETYDEVTRPSHYCRGGMEYKDVLAAMMDGVDVPPLVAYWWGCALKYLWRWTQKGLTPSERARDLRKAVECLRECEKAYTAHVASQRARVAAMVGEVEG